MVQIGFNLLVASGFVTSEHYPLLDRLKALGYDGVEIRIFDDDLPHYQELGRVCRDKGLRTTFATIVTEDTNPLSPDPRVRAKARGDPNISFVLVIGGDDLRTKTLGRGAEVLDRHLRGQN